MNKKIVLSAIDTQITPIIHAVQYDTDRFIDCYFEDIDLTDLTHARLYAKKPDGTEVYNDCTIETGYITAPLTSQTLAAVGTVSCQLQLVYVNTLTSFEFSVIVEKSLVSASAIESSDEYTALENALAEVDDVIQGLPAKEDKINKVTSIDQDSTDIEYPSAKCTYDAIQNAVGDISGKEDKSNKVTSIDSSSTDTQYPSAKCVYDEIDTLNTALGDKFDKSGGTITGNVTITSGRITLNGTTPNPGILANGKRIANIGAPTVSTDAANKSYVDTAVSGKEDTANKVTSIDQDSTDTQYPSAKCVYDLIGDINSILSNLATP